MSERVFEEDVEINKYKLPDECAEHSSFYHYWGDAWGNAKSDLDDAEDGLKLAAAESELRIRDNWDEYSNAKMTENGIKSILESSKVIQDARANVRLCKRSVNTLAAAESAMRHRKDKLDNLVQLLIKGFYAAPDGGKREGVVEQTGTDIRKGLNKGKENG